jgi:outer membrane protein assembly factor BamB
MIRHRLCRTGCALAAGLWVAATATPLWAEDWPQLQHDPQHSGRSNVAVSTGSTAKWVWVDEANLTHDFQSQNNAKINYPNPREVVLAGNVQPIVAGDTVFFGAANGLFFALRGQDGTLAWKRQLNGAVLHTAAFAEGKVIVGCMDHRIYGLDAADGKVLWSYQTGAGISAAPIIVNRTVLVGSRDGTFYALGLDGSLKWRYRTIADDPDHPFCEAPIFQSAASDGIRVFFGAENMYFYALDLGTGTELWRRKLGGTSFEYTWPVVYLDPGGDPSKNLVLTFVMVPFGKSEDLMEAELDVLPNLNNGESLPDYAARVWPLERGAIRQYLNQHPAYRNFYALKPGDGSNAFAEEIPMGRVGGIGYPGRAPVIDGQNRILLYWRTKSATFLTGGTFGSKYTPDISAMNSSTGDRIWLSPGTTLGAELDNNFVLTVGGDWLYLSNHMRGVRACNLTTGDSVFTTMFMASWDGANYRNWGAKLIWWGNDDNPDEYPPPSRHRSPQGDCGAVPVTVAGKSMLIIQESGHYQINFGCLAGLEAQ